MLTFLLSRHRQIFGTFKIVDRRENDTNQNKENEGKEELWSCTGMESEQLWSPGVLHFSCLKFTTLKDLIRPRSTSQCDWLLWPLWYLIVDPVEPALFTATGCRLMPCLNTVLALAVGCHHGISVWIYHDYYSCAIFPDFFQLTCVDHHWRTTICTKKKKKDII